MYLKKASFARGETNETLASKQSVPLCNRLVL